VQSVPSQEAEFSRPISRASEQAPWLCGAVFLASLGLGHAKNRPRDALRPVGRIGGRPFSTNHRAQGKPVFHLCLLKYL